MCECESCKKYTAEEAYLGVSAMDAVTIKAIKVSEISQIARSEIRLRNFLLKSWKELTENVVKKASKEINKKTTKKKLNTLIKKEVKKWSKGTKAVFKRELRTTYRLGKTAGTKRANGENVKTGYGKKEIKSISKNNEVKVLKITLTPEDEAAINAMLNQQLFWIGEFYEDNLSDAISKIVSETMIELGYGSALAGEILSEKLTEAFGYLEVPGGYNGTTVQYFESLAANTVTVARAHGVLRSFLEYGITRYEITNPDDNRTCERCSWLNGKSFSVEQGVTQMEAVLSAKDKQGVKDAHPWLTFAQITQISSAPGKISGSAGLSDSEALAAAGVSLPPFHFRCRCSIDIAEESIHFEEAS
jgi:hypothetical protein